MNEMKYPFLDLGVLNSPFAEELKAAAARVIDSGRYIGGAEVEAFERNLATMCQVPHVVGVSNGLDALRLIFGALIELKRLKPGDKVVVPANTYIASVLALSHNGLVPVFAEPDSETHNLDTARLETIVNADSSIKAILVVHLYGRPCYDEALARVVRNHGLILVEDNAQAIGAHATIESPYGTTATGSLGVAAGFSFYPTKNLGALGDAGAMATHDAELAATVRALANYGSEKRYHNIYCGFNCRIDPVQAAFINVKMPHLDAENAHRRAVAAVYDTVIDNPAVVKPRRDDPDISVWHQYVLCVRHREKFREYLAQNGVGTDIHYPVAPHMQPCYSAFSELPLPVATRLAASVVSIPVSSATSLSDACEIAHIINRYTDD